MPYLLACFANRMPQVKSIFLGLILAIPFAGAFGWFTGRLVVVRHEVKAKLATDKHAGPLVKLTFARGDVRDLLAWEHSREFRYQGEMYDVARTEEATDSISYWCHHDVKETSIRREISKWLARTFGRGDNGTPAPVRQLVHFFANMYPPGRIDFGLDLHSEKQDRPGGIVSSHVDGMTLRPPVPPPRTC
jgi:hypothetical protein